MSNTQDVMKKVTEALDSQKDNLKGLDIKFDKKSNNITIQKDEKFVPKVYCKANYKADSSQINLGCKLPLLSLVQDMANKGIYVDDIKPTEVIDIVKRFASERRLSVTTTLPHGTWVSYPRDLTVTYHQANASESSISEMIIAFVHMIQDSMDYIEKNYSKCLVINDKVTKADA